MAEEGIPTYYPGDEIVLEVEIEHQLNFRQVEAVFVQHPEREDVIPLKTSMSTRNLTVKDVRADGTKVSVVRFEKLASRNWAPGVYELTELCAETVGALPGESKRGRTVVFDVSDIDRPRLRFEEEAWPVYTVVRRAQLR